MNDNIQAGLSNEAYHDMTDAIGSSGLKKFAVTPRHYWAEYIDPDRVKNDKKVFRIGRAWHTAIFEPDMFESRYAIDHDVNKNTKRAQLLSECLASPEVFELLVAIPDDLKPTTKEGKLLVAEIEAGGQRAVIESDYAWINEWLPKLSGKDVLSAETIANVQKAAALARTLPISRVIFDKLGEHGAAEHSMFWRDPVSGVLLKIRPDYLLLPCETFPNGLIVDGKTTVDASSEGFGKQVWNLEYGLQAALYTHVYQQVLGTSERPPFLWLAQEKESPHGARYYGAGDDLLKFWDRRIGKMLPAVASCQQSGVWPCYPETVQLLDVPPWAQKQLDDAA